MSGQPSGEVERLEPWQLPAYLHRLEQHGTAEVTWNKEQVAMVRARQLAAGLGPTTTVVVDGTTIYVAEPDHSADETPRTVPIQIGPRRR